MTPSILTERGQNTSASNAMADSLCAGRHQAQLGLPEPEPSEEAKAGTRIHDLLAGSVWVGACPPSHEEVSIAELLEAKANEFRKQFEAGSNFTQALTHYRMWLLCGKFAHSGEADVVLPQGGRAAVLDFKTGWADVPDSDTNLQLRDLAVLVFRNFPRIKSVEVAIVDRFNPPIVTRYEIEDLKRAEKELRARVRASNAKNAKRIPGPIQCKYCKAFGTERCRESTALVHSIRSDLLPYGMEVNLTLGAPEKLVEIQRLKPLVLKLCSQVTDEIRRRLQQDPASVPGASLAKPKVLKPIVDPDTVFERATGLGIERKAIMGAIKMTKGPLEDCVREATGLGGKELRQKMDELLAGCTEEKACEPEVEVE